MLHLNAIVSRKTPGDGRLEIPALLAERLTGIADLSVELPDGEIASASIEQMACTCAKAGGENHVHHFVRSELLRTLTAGASVDLAVDAETGTIQVDPQI